VEGIKRRWGEGGWPGGEKSRSLTRDKKSNQTKTKGCGLCRKGGTPEEEGEGIEVAKGELTTNYYELRRRQKKKLKEGDQGKKRTPNFEKD